MKNTLTELLGISYPIIGGAMYPCSNPELVAAVSEAGGIGIVQPLSLVYVYGYEFRAGLRKIRSLTNKPIGMNMIVEKSARIYEERMNAWMQIALEEGVRFFITALGNPAAVVKAVHAQGGVVFHDVTEKRWALKALAAGVDGLVCVNDRAGGHLGTQSPEHLFSELSSLGVPLVCAGGVGASADFARAINLGYVGVQIGTRFIATVECSAHDSYKQAIVNANATDIVVTDRVTGVPLSVINTPYLERSGARAGKLARILLKNPRTRHFMRFMYSLISVWKLKKSVLKGLSTKDFWQAGKSVDGVKEILPVRSIVNEFMQALDRNPAQ